MPAEITIDRLRALCDSYRQHHVRSTLASSGVLSTLEMQIQILDELIAFKEREETGGWIRVEQMLPDDDIVVLVWTEFGQEIGVGMPGGTWHYRYGEPLQGVKAWQHLPADFVAETETGDE